MIEMMRALALKAERLAQSGTTVGVRERARGQSDAASWWYARHVELLIGRPEAITALVTEAREIAAAEEGRGNPERARGRRAVDQWVLRGLEGRWQADARLRPDKSRSDHDFG